MYNLFLDDERLPQRVTWVNLPSGPWTVVRSYKEFCECVTKNGLPYFVTFDHDLSVEDQNKHPITGKFVEKTGMDCAKWLVEQWMDGKPVVDVVIHSANAIGSGNMMGYINNYRHINRLPQNCIRVQIEHTV